MYSTFDYLIKDEQWAEIIFRLWSISRDIYPLFGRLIFTKEEPKVLFEEFLQSKEKLHGVEPQPAQQPHQKGNNGGPNFWKDFRDWYLQN